MHIVIHTFGSLGDLYPYLAIAEELQRRKHRATLATSSIYRELIEASGVGFRPVRPELQLFLEQDDIFERITDPKRGTEYVVRRMILSHLRDTYDDLLSAVTDADLLFTGPLSYVASMVAEKRGIPWVSSVLAPVSFLSAFDPPVLAPMPWLSALWGFGPAFHKPLFALMRRATRSWGRPLLSLREELGLSQGAADQLYKGQFSALLNLALFSRILAEPQPDWPLHTVITGFPLYRERNGEVEFPANLHQFLQEGDSPVVFTLGSTAVHEGGEFFAESVETVRLLGCRAVLSGLQKDNPVVSHLPDSSIACGYVSYAALFPLASVIVHQGGIGTTAEALAAGKPMLIVPFSNDQPDNADRVKRIGCGEVLGRKHYNSQKAVQTLEKLLSDSSYRDAAHSAAEMIRNENGVDQACTEIEKIALGREK